MEMPSPDRFRRHDGYEEWPPWEAGVQGEDFSVTVPDWADAPHPSSLAFAARVLPELHALLAEAVQHVQRMVNARAACLLGEPRISSVHANAHENTVTLDLYWDDHVYTLWYVTFEYHPLVRRHIRGFGCRDHRARAWVDRQP
ncbi:hypothetical protein [Longimicrobium sp.]|uniref:hypothetical protein n=1 Tax=Longimicrobium sp. TaxID=2029185 RepID=UPI003B3B73D3